MSMRTPLGQVRGLGSAKSGTGHFLMQRLTAIANLPLIVFFVWFIVAHLGTSRARLVASLHNPAIAIVLTLAFLSILWHMRLGMQAIVEDYVHGHGAKLACLVLNSFFTAALGAAALYAILKMSFGI
ncbi:MAG: succinate dehydrogenase, hydrophobic membrane anchor protein [Hyphomicrobiales bacterium]